MQFLVGAFLVKRARLLQWLVFFLFSSDHRRHRVCTTFYRLYSFTCTRQYRLYSVYGEPNCQGFESLLLPETFRAIFFGTVRLFQFFRHCVTFFRIFLHSKSPTFKFFMIFCRKLKCQKAQRVSRFMYFGTVRLFKILIFFEN